MNHSKGKGITKGTGTLEKEYIILCMNLTNLILSYNYGSNLKLYIKVGVSFKRINILKEKVMAVDILVLRIWEIK